MTRRQSPPTPPLQSDERVEDEGCAQWGIRDFVAEDLGPGHARATIDWDMKDSDGAPIRGWRQTYDVTGGLNHWRVQHATLHAGSEVAYPVPPNHRRAPFA